MESSEGLEDVFNLGAVVVQGSFRCVACVLHWKGFCHVLSGGRGLPRHDRSTQQGGSAQ